MPEAKINVLREAPDLNQLAEEVARLQKLLRWLLNGQIDFENIRARSIKGENIEAETITTTELAADSVTADKIAAGSVTTDKLDAGAVTADKIDAGAVTTSKLAAGAVTADKIDVNELSAISADLGTITAGSITSNATINVGTDVNVGRNIYLDASNTSSSKGIIFHDNGATVARIDVTSGDIGINSSGYVLLNGGSGAYANGGRIAVEGISVAFDVMGSDGVTPRTLTFVGGTLRSVT